MKQWKPHPKQQKALLSLAYETLYGGARGGGKTDSGIVWMIAEPDPNLPLPIENPEYRGLVIRKNYTDLKDWIDRAMLMYRKMGAKYLNGDTIAFPSGAKILLGHYADDKAYMKYQGHEYHRMLIEELTQIPTLELYLKLIASCRSTVEGIKPRVFGTTNPGGPGHSWVKQRFVDPAPPMTEFSDPISGRARVYIPATVDDNPTLGEKDPDYVKFLDSLPEDLKAQWRYGSWENMKVKGAYYGDEIIKANQENRVCELAILPHVKVHTFWDIGLNDTMVCWFVQFVGDQINIFDIYFDSEKAFAFYLDMLEEKRYKFGYHVLPHDGTKRNQGTLQSFSDVLKSGGYDVKVIPRTKDKIRDINDSRAIFPRCRFDSVRCRQGVEALTSYRKKWDETRGVFMNSPLHDWASHYADAFQVIAQALKSIKFNSEKEKVDYNTAVNQYMAGTSGLDPIALDFVNRTGQHVIKR